MVSDETQRPTWAEINLDNLAFNLNSVKRFSGESLKYMAVVKADAYGHGAIQCSKRLESEGIDWFGVALPEEGLELRKAGIRKLILCLGSFWTGQERLLLSNDLTPVIYRIEKAESLNAVAKERGTVANFHLKIDTGMGRIGVRFDELNEFADKLISLKNLSLEGVMTHFAAADDLEQNPFTNEQIKRFNDSVSILQSKGFNPIYKDLANSPGTIAHPNSRSNMVRLGGVLYGLGEDVLPKTIEKPLLKPVLSLFSTITHLKRVPKGETLGYSRTFTTKKDSIIATIPIGYQDGFNRNLSNKGQAIINGKFVPVVGRISMDWTILDVTNVTNVKINDKVTLIGTEHSLSVSAENLASKCDTISYEITCGINRRVPRYYVGSK